MPSVNASGGAKREQLSIAATIAKLIMRRSFEVFVWRPAETQRGAVEALAIASHVEAALKTELEREGFRYRQTVLKSEDRETVGPVDAVLELITTDYGSVFAKA